MEGQASFAVGVLVALLAIAAGAVALFGLVWWLAGKWVDRENRLKWQ